MKLKSSARRVAKKFAVVSAIALMSGIMPMVAGAEQAATDQQAPAAEAPAAEAPAAAPAEAGDAAIGKALFTGEKGFANGGPACISCHGASIGTLGGGTLGPDLTKVYVDETKNPLLSAVWINSDGSPTMGPIFKAKNVTDEEVDHLRAFLKGQGQQTPASAGTGTFAGIGILGSVGMLVLFGLIWSGRYSKRNRDTAHDAIWRNYGGKGGA
ncbi:MAG: hypothetical protein OEV28_01380 [Nitrospirota bacterium]|nr:hypothetical protein [Nitrospirota bacterium]